MTTNFQRVQEFHDVFGIETSSKPRLPDATTLKLRLDLIDEERTELDDALEANDIVEVADALTDMLYVIYGMMDVCGIDANACFAEVHASNMSKLDENGHPIINDGVMRPDLPVGKVIKGPNFRVPNFKQFLEG